MATRLAQKLRIQAGNRVLVLQAPEGFAAALAPLPEGVHLETAPQGSYDVVHLFVRDSTELERHLKTAIGAVRTGGVLWIAWPKKSARVTTDLARDTLWALVQPAGWGPVASVAIDDTWSGLRFKPGVEVSRST
ncbi:MAG TPA: hypothetical protein VGP82_12795 [Ktedonobacterales bacterium]|jgi:hypothetical protein|nr:hypothetical protein [Ktedonobacterales bacterium]